MHGEVKALGTHRRGQVDRDAVDAEKLDSPFDNPLCRIEGKIGMNVVIRALEFFVPAGVEHDDVTSLNGNTSAFKIFGCDLLPSPLLYRDHGPRTDKRFERELLDRFSIRDNMD